MTKAQGSLKYRLAAKKLKVMAHPIRLDIMNMLSDAQELNVSQLQENLKLEQAIVSQHLSLLKEQQLLKSRKEGKHCVYSLTNENVLSVVSSINNYKLD
jgi:DNA-binding transcriptional ArsR family regulator